jgi:hypothetical protein
MAGANMDCEQELVQLGLAQKASGVSLRLPYRWLFRVPTYRDVCARFFLSEVYVIGKPLCPV